MSNQNRLNIYTCDRCFRHMVTWDKDKGTTPFLTSCRMTLECSGTAKSSMYRVWDQRMRPDFFWFKPLPGNSLLDSPAVRYHVEQGGLVLAPFPEKEEWDGEARS